MKQFVPAGDFLIQSLWPRVHFDLNGLNFSHPEILSNRDRYLTIVHELTHLLTLIGTSSGWRIQAIFHAMAFYQLALLASASKLNHGVVQVPFVSSANFERLKKFDDKWDVFGGISFSERMNEAMLMLETHFGSPASLSSVKNRFNVDQSELSYSFEDEHGPISEWRSIWPVLKVKTEDQTTHEVHVTGHLVCEGLAKFVELEHLRRIWGEAEYQAKLRSEIAHPELSEYYVLYKLYEKYCGSNVTSPAEFIVICEISLSFDKYHRNIDKTKEVTNSYIAGNDVTEWEEFWADDYGPGYYFLIIVEILRDKKFVISRVESGNSRTYFEFSKCIVKEIENKYGITVSQDYSFLNTKEDIWNEVFYDSTYIFDLFRAGIELRKGVGSLLSLILIDPEGFVRSVSGLPVAIEFDQFSLIGLGDLAGREFQLARIELALLGNLGFDGELVCPCGQEFEVAGDHSSLECENRPGSPHLNEQRQCMYLQVLRHIKRKCGINEFQRHSD